MKARLQPYGPAAPSDSVRITQLVLSNAFAGTEQHVALLSRELAALGVRVRLVCGDRNTRMMDEMHGTGVTVCPLRLGKGNLPTDWTAAHRDVIGWGAHIVHAHLGSSLLCGAALTAPGRQQLVFTQHFIKAAYREGTGPRIMARALAHRVVHRRVAFGIASTRLVRSEMVEHEGFTQAKTAVIPFGIDVRRIMEQARRGTHEVRAELNLPGDAVLLVTPARLEQVKGHATLLEALPRVLAQHHNTYLLLAGTGALEQTLKEQVRRLGIARHVRFLGQRTDVPRLLMQAAMCILPSYEDSFGLVLLEAMALGVPVIACSVGGPREIVAHCQTGLLVPPREPGAIAGAIEAVLGNLDRAREMGSDGRRRVLERFTARRMAEQTLRMYGTLMTTM